MLETKKTKLDGHRKASWQLEVPKVKGSEESYVITASAVVNGVNIDVEIGCSSRVVVWPRTAELKLVDEKGKACKNVSIKALNDNGDWASKRTGGSGKATVWLRSPRPHKKPRARAALVSAPWEIQKVKTNGFSWWTPRPAARARC